MSDFFGESRMTKQQRKHIAHGTLTRICAEFIASGNFHKDLEEQDYIDALKENMSTKLGSTKREVIFKAYDAAIAKAKADAEAAAEAAAEPAAKAN